MGTPKALVHDADGSSWLRTSVRALSSGGCDQVYVVLGAAAEQARPLLHGLAIEVVVAADWSDGMAASLRVGLAAVTRDAPVLVSLVDLPDVGAEVMARVLAAPAGPTDLARAVYDGRPGHPVLIGASHLDPLMVSLHGDVGARAYLERHDVTLVECGDLASGVDVDSR